MDFQTPKKNRFVGFFGACVPAKDFEMAWQQAGFDAGVFFFCGGGEFRRP